MKLLQKKFCLIPIIKLVAFLFLIGCKDSDPKLLGTNEVKYTQILPDLSNIDPSFNSVQFVSPQIGFITGASLLNPHDAVILKTQDGGKNWQQLPADTSLHRGITSFFALDSQILFATTANPNRPGFTRLSRSSDGGQFWQLLSTTILTIGCFLGSGQQSFA
ncbi:WD40/YVTN/BNR-like repeat-containing protein [Spirosoma jeollabukense]